MHFFKSDYFVRNFAKFWLRKSSLLKNWYLWRCLEVFKKINPCESKKFCAAAKVGLCAAAWERRDWRIGSAAGYATGRACGCCGLAGGGASERRVGEAARALAAASARQPASQRQRVCANRCRRASVVWVCVAASASSSSPRRGAAPDTPDQTLFTELFLESQNERVHPGAESGERWRSAAASQPQVVSPTHSFHSETKRGKYDRVQWGSGARPTWPMGWVPN